MTQSQKQQQDKTQIDELVKKVESLELLIPKIQGENEELIAINRAMKEQMSQQLEES